MPSTFLQAEWRKLAMANYAVDPNVLQPYLPKGVELDFKVLVELPEVQLIGLPEDLLRV